MSIYQFEVEQPNGDFISLDQYKGRVALIVNTASKCQFTPQFDDLQRMYERFGQEGLEILGFPCNQFADQEPGTSEEAASFCRINYGVTFKIFSKVDVNGPEADSLFKYLKQQAPFQGFDLNDIQAKLLKLMIAEKYPEWLVGDDIKWNFTKFLIDQNGDVVKRYEPTDEIDRIEGDIERLLNA
jgi:Glutathione peroxidase